MNFKLSTEQEDFRKSVKTFCEKEIAPCAEKLDREEMSAHEHFKKMGDMGLLGITFPSEYGGSDADLVTYAVGAEELSVACASTSLAVNASTTLAGEPIHHHGAEAQKKKYLTGLTSGTMVGCFGLTEPGSGSDAAALTTFARKEKDSYVLNGAKMFITNGPVADFAIVIARTEKDGGPKGISAFIVDKGAKGFTAGKPMQKMGVRGSTTSELIFEDCEIPAENLIGKEGEGFKIAMQTLEYARISISCFCLGIARAAMEDSIAYAETRRAFGKPIGAFQSVNHKIADMKMYTETARNLIYHAAWMKQEGHPDANVQISIAKLFTSRKATQIVNDAVQIHGGYGYSKEYRVERLYRDVKLGEIGEGTSEVQQLIIAKHLLKD